MPQTWPYLLMWSLNPSVLVGTAGFIGAYFLALRRFRLRQVVRNGQIAWFLLGTLVILLALISPLDTLGDAYLFSAHMVQHMLLAILAPPLLLLGVPPGLLEALLQRPGINRIAKMLTRPVAAFLLFNITFLGWHFQGFYEAALNNEALHIIEHLIFIVTGILNWWPILSPSANLPRLRYPAQALYLFLELIPSTILGAIISFSPTVLYPTYAAAPRVLNLSPVDDQQIAGLVMALPAGMIYMAAFTMIFFKWLEAGNSWEGQGSKR